MQYLRLYNIAIFTQITLYCNIMQYLHVYLILQYSLRLLNIAIFTLFTQCLHDFAIFTQCLLNIVIFNKYLLSIYMILYLLNIYLIFT